MTVTARAPKTGSMRYMIATKVSVCFWTMYTALDSIFAFLPRIGARTTFDRASELLGVDSVIRFQEKLNSLVTSGKISLDEEKILEVLVSAGSAAAQRGWRPTTEQPEHDGGRDRVNHLQHRHERLQEDPVDGTVLERYLILQ